MSTDGARSDGARSDDVRSDDVRSDDVRSDDSATTAVGGADALGVDRRGRRTNAEFGLALLLDLVGAGGAALISLESWLVITTHPPRPRPDDVLHVAGRTLDASPLAFALVALAGVVAVLATRGVVRRGVGVIVALAGAALVWRAVVASGTVSGSRARALVEGRHRAVSFTAGTTQQIATHPVWSWLTVACGVLVVVGGVLGAWHGHRWRAMSTRYESAQSRAADPARAAASMWSALDRGEDPTSRDRG